MKRRDFLKTTAVSGGILTMSPANLWGNTPFDDPLFFGVHDFIETHPEAVFIMRTDVDKKTNSSAIKSVGKAFARSVLVAKNATDPGAIPVTHKIAIKPNLTLRFNWDDRYTVEGTMGIVTDAYFVEGVIEEMKRIGIKSDQLHIIETNYNEEDLANGGYLDMVDRTGALLKNLYGGIGQIDESDIVWKDVQNGGYFKKIPYIFPVNAPDTWLLNIAKFKAHFMGITGCAKNLQGTVVRKYQQHCKSYASGDLEGMKEEHRVSNALEKIAQRYKVHKMSIPRWDHPTQGLDMETWVTRCLDNNATVTAGLHVIEGVYGRDGYFVAGPSQGDNDPDGLATDYMTNIILFGKNPFHVDIIAHWLAGHEPGNFGLFHLALERGLSEKLDPMDIPVYEWNRESTATLMPLTEFERTPLKSNYLQRNYNGQNEPYWQSGRHRPCPGLKQRLGGKVYQPLRRPPQVYPLFLKSGPLGSGYSHLGYHRHQWN
jgi:uncharacterized protein (DUF362 family)